MRLFRVRGQIPQSSPPSRMIDGGPAADQRFVWETLVPRLLYPARLLIIQTLLRTRRPLSPTEFAEAADLTVELARYHCKAMATAGVLEIVNVAGHADGDGDEPSYFFLQGPQADLSGSSGSSGA